MAETHKATISIKAETLGDLNEALDAIARASSTDIAVKAAFSTTITIEAGELPDLGVMLDNIAAAVAASECEVTAKAPMAAYRNRRLDPTPIERAINDMQRSGTSVELRAGGKVARIGPTIVIDEDELDQE